MVPAINEPMKIAIFAVLTIIGISYARRSIKIDIVNPMPPGKPTAIILLQFKSEVKEHKPILTPTLSFPNH